jgi:hypothetical protein
MPHLAALALEHSLMPFPTLSEFVAEHFPGDFTATADGGFVVTCPACKTADALKVRPVAGTVALFCSVPDCSRETGPALGFTEERWEALLDTVRVPKPSTDEDGDGGKRVSADDVVEWILDNYRVGRSTDGLLYAVPTFPGAARIAREVRAIRSDVVRRFREERKAEGGKGYVLGRDMLSSALEAVAAYADAEEPTTVCLRSAQIGDDRLVLDLGDNVGNLVDITSRGWNVVPSSDDTPLFRRSEATQPLPLPVRGRSLDTLRELIGLEETDTRWLIVRGWLVASLFSEIPRPLLWASGPQGSGKSTRARMVIGMVEPTPELGKEPGRNERDDSTAARARYVVSYDNLTAVSQSTSDWLCRLVTGVTDDRRALYTDDGLRPVSFRRTGVATSLMLPPGLGSDALERIAHVGFDRPAETDRRGERELWTAYEAARPEMLGALLDLASGVLEHLEAATKARRTRPRMADYSNVLAALDAHLRLPEGAGHLAAYVAGVNTSQRDRALDDPFTRAVLVVIAEAGGKWSGSLDAALSALVLHAGPTVPKWWPANPRALRSQLVKAQVPLENSGVDWEIARSNGTRRLTLTGPATMPDDAEDGDEKPSPAGEVTHDSGLPF